MYSKDTGKDQMLMTMERALTSGQKASSRTSSSTGRAIRWKRRPSPRSIATMTVIPAAMPLISPTRSLWHREPSLNNISTFRERAWRGTFSITETGASISSRRCAWRMPISSSSGRTMCPLRATPMLSRALTITSAARSASAQKSI